MILDKIQSGFLLLETPQGFARIELSPRQRLYLLWTFRNFRHLSVQLLNLRERELVNSLFRDDAEVMPEVDDSDLVIGVVENFVSHKTGAGASARPKVIPKKVQPKTVMAQAAAVARRPDSVSREAMAATSGAARTGLATAELATVGLATKPATTERATTGIETERANARPMVVQPSRAERRRRKLLITRVATAFAALCLCVGSVAAWYRIQGLPVSQANNRQVRAVAANSPNSVEAEARVAPSVAQAAPVAPSAAASGVASEAGAEHVSATEAALRSASITAAVPASMVAHVAMDQSISNLGACVRDAASTSARPLPGQDGVIEASRAPLYSVYPDSPDGRVHGAVSLKAGLDAAGKVRTVKLISGNRALAIAAMRAVRQWRYRPYLKDGQPVATETYVVISFISDDVVSMISLPAFRGLGKALIAGAARDDAKLTTAQFFHPQQRHAYYPRSCHFHRSRTGKNRIGTFLPRPPIFPEDQPLAGKRHAAGQGQPGAAKEITPLGIEAVFPV